MASVWGELKRRNVVKVAIAYAVVAWLLIEVASTVLPTFEAPQWVLQTITFVIILGFPLALVLSWIFDITPGGVERTDFRRRSEGAANVSGRRFDFMIIGVLAIAVAFFLVERSLLDTSAPFAGAEVDPASLEPDPDEGPSTETDEQAGILTNSVAVLPFENLSPDPDNAYFAAGIHESIISQLARLRDLNVIARTSVMEYEGVRRSISDIARELRVESVMEGSVRYAGDRVLVTAQLIDGDTGAHLWVDEYEGELSDVFGIQSDISMNIANALEAEFSLAEQAGIERPPTDSPLAYSLYLNALALWGEENEAWRLPLDRAIALDPQFALAYAARAYLNTFTILGFGGGRDQAEEFVRLVQEDANLALSMDPTLGTAEAALAVLHQVNWRGAAAELAFQRALDSSPNDANVLLMYGRFKRYRNEHAEGIRLVRRAVELDPNNPLPRGQIAINYRDAAEWDAAATAYGEILDRNPSSVASYVGVGVSEAARGDRAAALSNLEIAETFDPPAFRLAQMAHAYRLLDRPEDVMRIIERLEEIATENTVSDGLWASVYLAAGDDEQALRWLESAVNNRRGVDFATLTYLSANPWGYPELDREDFQGIFNRLWLDE